MSARPRRSSRRNAVCLLAVAAGIALASAGDASPALATAFNPTLEITLGDSSPGAASDVTYHITIAAPDSMFQSLVAFTPAEFGLTAGAAVPDGAYAGTIAADTRFGLVNGACDTPVDVAFPLMEASTNPNESIPAYVGVEDYNGNGLPDNVDYYPSFLNVIVPGITPVQRLYGQVLVAGLWNPINLVFFEPGARLPLLPSLDEALGYPALAFITDPVAPFAPNAISDFCTPLDVTVVLNGVSADNPATPANEAGHTLRTNPAAAGDYSAVLFARSRWDADNDGIENNLDSCPLTPDAGWDPRDPASPFDADGDGLPLSCDPNDNPNGGGTNSDQDGDGYLNRQDNCAMAVNIPNVDTDMDGIGDACDQFPGDARDAGASHRHDVCLVSTVTIGSPAGGDPPPVSCPSGPDLPMPAMLSLYADEEYGAVGSTHSISAFLFRRSTHEPISAVTVAFSVSGANPATGACVTDDFGGCEFEYSGANTGTDEITATAVVDGVSSVASATIEWVGPPANDAFADALEVGPLPFKDIRILTAATTEADEPAECGGAGNTVWYVFTPPEDMPVHLLAYGFFPVTLAVYEGQSLPELQLVACPGAYTPYGIDHAQVAFLLAHLQADSTYYIRAGSSSGGAAYMNLDIAAVAPGDADCDGLVTSRDALAMLRTAAGLPTAAGCMSVADVDCDGDVDTVDALRVLRVVAGLGPGPPEPC